MNKKKTKPRTMKQILKSIAETQDQRNKASEAQWLKYKRSSTEQSIMDAGREKPKTGK